MVGLDLGHSLTDFVFMTAAMSSHQSPSVAEVAHHEETSSGRRSATVWVVRALLGLATVLGVALLFPWPSREQPRPAAGATVIPAPYDADRAFGYLLEICELGPRPSATPAMRRQQELLTAFFEQRGAAVELQRFEVRHPQTGEAVELANLIASWHPQRPKRFLLCAHYDTRPFPDRDPVNPRGRFVGANDGGSGVAALMELSNHFEQLPADVGVDIVLFDGEELVYEEGRDDYFLGSTYFARTYLANPPAVPYRAGVLLDMVGDKELKIYYERNSWNYAREVCKSVFATAETLGVDAFVPRIRHEIRDDHLPLNQIARIPTIDLIDFDYPRPGIGAPQYWHTTRDVPENCSGHSLATVVYVVHQWLMRQ